jgi:tetratricopeptide (TPR) repeat protein
VTQTRRQKIEALLRDDPSDCFLRYSLALELEGGGEWEAALELLESLGRESLPYVPALQMAGQFLAARGRHDEARAALREGIEAARSQGNTHAAGEMAELLMSLGSA